ncbi:MAG: glucokinase [Thelocarpon superellum]|nr:MAG: glucokinase [Thelocarpon superellum]
MSLLDEAQRIAASFDFGPDDLRKNVQEFIRQMREGLQKPNQTMSQIPTYVTSVPNGTEKGLFLAVDLGGTNFRVCSIQLHGNSSFTLTQSKRAIPQELMVAKTAKELFAYLARQIEIFLKTHHTEHFEAHVRRRLTMSADEGYRDENIFRLGFTFSFPVQQIGINRGTLIRWTKGFDIEDAIGKDVCVLLQTEIDALKLPVRVAALVNDTVGTLMARSYASPGKTGTFLGAIFGTGTNGAYMEKLSKIKKLTGVEDGAEFDSSTGEMIVNTEWGSFDNGLRVLPTTEFDRQLDEESVNPGIQMFEKRVSGMFLGEILRRAIVRLIESPKAGLFKDADSRENDIHSTTTIAEDSALYKQWGIDTSFLSIVQGDHSPGLRLTRQSLDRDLGVSAASLEDAQAVRALVTAIGKRSARLGAVAIGAVIIATDKLGRSTSTSPSLSTSDPAAPKSIQEIAQDVKEVHLAQAAHAAASKLQASAAPLVDAPPHIPSSSDLPSANEGEGGEAEPVDIGVDGSLIEFYPGFEDDLREALREIPEIGPAGEKRIRIGIAKDGSGVGAALIALVAG